MTNEQAEFLSEYLRGKSIQHWGHLSESDEEQASERRDIERELEMSPQEIYDEAVRQAIDQIDVPPAVSGVEVGAGGRE